MISAIKARELSDSNAFYVWVKEVSEQIEAAAREGDYSVSVTCPSAVHRARAKDVLLDAGYQPSFGKEKNELHIFWGYNYGVST